ncbi:hypothetical protein F4777DRAFT_385914 [Nemania sp. FL0916]|nr:hypothetical protein F4777DRAFT_385914 [Nemania sp. FL0916]
MTYWCRTVSPGTIGIYQSGTSQSCRKLLRDGSHGSGHRSRQRTNDPVTSSWYQAVAERTNPNTGSHDMQTQNLAQPKIRDILLHHTVVWAKWYQDSCRTQCLSCLNGSDRCPDLVPVFIVLFVPNLQSSVYLTTGLCIPAHPLASPNEILCSVYENSKLSFFHRSPSRT